MSGHVTQYSHGRLTRYTHSTHATHTTILHSTQTIGTPLGIPLTTPHHTNTHPGLPTASIFEHNQPAVQAVEGEDGGRRDRAAAYTLFLQVSESAVLHYNCIASKCIAFNCIAL